MTPRLGGKLVLVAIVAAIVPSVRGQVIPVQDLQFSTVSGRIRISIHRFREASALAVTQTGVALSLVAIKDGNWRLFRVRRWHERTPQQDVLMLPGFISNGERPNIESVGARILVTGDNRFAVCVGDVTWRKRVGGRAVED